MNYHKISKKREGLLSYTKSCTGEANTPSHKDCFC